MIDVIVTWLIAGTGGGEKRKVGTGGDNNNQSSDSKCLKADYLAGSTWLVRAPDESNNLNLNLNLAVCSLCPHLAMPCYMLHATCYMPYLSEQKSHELHHEHLQRKGEFGT